MHPEAYGFVSRFATDEPLTVVEFGSRNVNYTVRPLFPNADWWGVDAQPGPCVDEVADAATWRPCWSVDLLICCEVFEHTPDWAQIVANAFEVLTSGGRVVLTCAGPGRPEHGVDIDDPLNPGHYRNVDVDELRDVLIATGFDDIECGTVPNRSCGGGVDTQATGVRP